MVDLLLYVAIPLYLALGAVLTGITLVSDYRYGLRVWSLTDVVPLVLLMPVLAALACGFWLFDLVTGRRP